MEDVAIKTNFKLPVLPYPTDALEPYIDKTTMEIHHGKHHNGYTTNLNTAITGTQFEGKTIEEILRNISKLSVAVRNNGGGYYNHCIFWKIMKPNGGGQPVGALSEAINTKWGTFEEFKARFTNTAITRFGSGWTWLIVKDGTLEITSTPNQDNPLMDVSEVKGKPVMGLDVWEHAYYLKYQNRRPDYISAWWNTINWEEVTNRFNQAMK